MTKLINALWENVLIGAEAMHENDNRIIYDKNKENDFKEAFQKNIDTVREYMSNSSENLDRHKVAAVIIISIIETNPLSCPENDPARAIFFGNYILATEIGLSYMRGQLNEFLLEIHEPTIGKYFFPQSWICNNDYFRVFYRNLYFANNNTNNWKLNPLDIAERLFYWNTLICLSRI